MMMMMLMMMMTTTMMMMIMMMMIYLSVCISGTSKGEMTPMRITEFRSLDNSPSALHLFAAYSKWGTHTHVNFYSMDSAVKGEVSNFRQKNSSVTCL